jgi:hypothetical protein
LREFGGDITLDWQDTRKRIDKRLSSMTIFVVYPPPTGLEGTR